MPDVSIDFPEVRYAEADGVHIAYEARGQGPIDLVRLPGLLGGLVAGFLDPVASAHYERLARFSRLIQLDRRGMGMSDPLLAGGAPPLEQQVDDVIAVMNEVGSNKAVLIGAADGAALALFFAAMHPEKVSALILTNPPWNKIVLVRPGVDGADVLREVRDHWGDVDSPWLVDSLAPSRLAEPGFIQLLARVQQVSASKAAAVANFQVRIDTELGTVLPLVQAPTLVLVAEEVHAARESAALVADCIPGARVATYRGTDLYFGSGSAEMADLIEEFVTGTRPVVVSDRVLATVLFTDIVGSTERAAALGDRAWRELLARFRGAVRENLQRYKGREINTRGDDFLATFDGPARAIQCAQAITVAAAAIDVGVRSGLHTGEIEVMGDDVAGIAVHIGARVSALAGAGEVLVTSVVRDLVAGSGIGFSEHSRQTLKGVSGDWTILSVA